MWNCKCLPVDAAGKPCWFFFMSQAKFTIVPCCRPGMLLWLAVWLLVVPLFHVHPEADHRHGQAGQVLGGVVHTVWSPDLDCEFDHHHAIDRTERSARDTVATRTQFSHVGDGHSELTFSLLNDSSDRKQVHPLLMQALAVTQSVIPGSDVSIRRQEPPADVSFSARFLHDLPFRAPPDSFV